MPYCLIAASAEYSGIHQRRDKRFLIGKPRITHEDALEQTIISESESPEGEDQTCGRSEWNKAIMLWLSWNNTYEKATARMCKSGNRKKVEAMLNEMEFLRRQAIELSQGLLGC